MRAKGELAANKGASRHEPEIDRQEELAGGGGLRSCWACRCAAFAQVAPPLGTAAQFGALGNSGVTGSTGLGTIVNGDVGSSPTPAISNFPPSTTAFLAPFTC